MERYIPKYKLKGEKKTSVSHLEYERSDGWMINLYKSLKYKLKGETKSSVSHLAYKRDDGLYMAELYQFTCDHKVVDLQILFDGSGYYTIMTVVGIEFRPLEKDDR